MIKKRDRAAPLVSYGHRHMMPPPNTPTRRSQAQRAHAVTTRFIAVYFDVYSIDLSQLNAASTIYIYIMLRVGATSGVANDEKEI